LVAYDSVASKLVDIAETGGFSKLYPFITALWASTPNLGLIINFPFNFELTCLFNFKLMPAVSAEGVSRPY
jgi:hypothetical protein